jgi:hypothetical protein
MGHKAKYTNQRSQFDRFLVVRVGNKALERVVEGRGLEARSEASEVIVSSSVKGSLVRLGFD